MQTKFVFYVIQNLEHPDPILPPLPAVYKEPKVRKGSNHSGKKQYHKKDHDQKQGKPNPKEESLEGLDEVPEDTVHFLLSDGNIEKAEKRLFQILGSGK